MAKILTRGRMNAFYSELPKITTTLDVTANDVLRGCQPSEKDVFYADVQMLLGDCSQRERQTLLEITAAVKQIFAICCINCESRRSGFLRQKAGKGVDFWGRTE